MNTPHPQRQFEMVPHDPRWAGAFESAADELRAALGGNLLAVHHIGSTSIPGIYAKPIIDMLPQVADLSLLDSQSQAMRSLGYEVKGEFGIPGRRYFSRNNSAGRRTHHVHAFAEGSPDLDRHLAFRDYLRTHPDLAGQYSDLKRRLAAAHPPDIEAYMDGKDGFIKQTETRALAWWEQRGSKKQPGD